MHYATLLIVLLAWGGMLFASQQAEWIPPAAVDDLTARLFDVAMTSIFIFGLDAIVTSIAADVSAVTSQAVVSSEKYSQVMEKLVERTEEVKMLQQMLGSRRRKVLGKNQWMR